MRRVFGPGVGRGLIQLSPPYLLLLTVLLATVGYLVGVAKAPVIKPYHEPPNWFGSYFTATLALTGTAFIGLVVPLAKVGFNVITIILTLAWMIAGIVASIVGLDASVSHNLYPQLLGLADAGAVAGLVAAFIMGIRSAVIAERRKRHERLSKMHQ